jgi:hypothetical protein
MIKKNNLPDRIGQGCGAPVQKQVKSMDLFSAAVIRGTPAQVCPFRRRFILAHGC